jgi:hypothetical protein
MLCALEGGVAAVQLRSETAGACVGLLGGGLSLLGGTVTVGGRRQ